jgi:NAD(P)-dependent dehydrogenase (short-subunit alcohol dehydrogenase family)
MFKLTDKTAVVTGAGSGIGQSVALLFAEQGARVVALDLDLDAAKKTAQGAKPETIFAVECDVANSASVSEAFAEIDGVLGKLDILVNSAGVAHVGSLTNTDEEAFDRLYRVNVKGTYLCSRAAVERMLPQSSGVIVNLASIASFIGLEDRFAYSMTKGAVLTMTRSIAVDYMGKIRCNCVAPARIHTPFVDSFLAKNYPGKEREMFETLAAFQPIGRMGKPEEVAALILYLCSDEAAFITGAAFPIDGGVLAK